MRILVLALITILLWPAAAAGQEQELSLSWRQLAFGGTNAYALAVGDGGKVLYLATDLGLQVSEDGGETWLYAGQGLEAAGAPRVEALAVSPSDPGTAFAGTLAGSHAGIYVTRDFGRTWQLAWWGMRAEGVRAIAIAEGEPERILAVAALREIGEDYVVVSPDFGHLWYPRRLDSRSYRIKILGLAFQPLSGTVAYAATTEGLQVSADGGETWRTSGRASSAVGVASIPGREGWLFATSGRDVLLSRDAGRSWQNARGPRLGACEAYAQDGLAVSSAEAPVLLATTDSSCPGEPSRVYGLILTGSRSLRWFMVDAGLPTGGRLRVVVDASPEPKAYALTADGLWVASLPVAAATAEPSVPEATTSSESGIKNAAPAPYLLEGEETPVAVPSVGSGPAPGPLGGEDTVVLLVSVAGAGIVGLLVLTRRYRG